MSLNVEIDWNHSVEIEGISYPKDTLDRAKYAEYLTNFLASKGYDTLRDGDDKKQNYVLNLNSVWGSGKTYFLRRWVHDLKAHHPVVYVDAWQQDYSDDPLMAVLATMISQLQTQAGKSPEDIKFKVPRKALGLLKAAAPIVAGGLAKQYLGIDPVKIMESSEDEPIGDKVKDENGNEIDMGAAASKIVSQLIDEHTAKSQAIDSLKRSIEQWVEAVNAYKISETAPNKDYPAFVFIDELDRCRPSYAVEMLEAIKHIFDIKGIVFVVATDTEQLQHAVKAVYGDRFDAGVYLGRFFDARYTLKEADYGQLIEVHTDLNKISMHSLNNKTLKVWPRCANESANACSGAEIERRNLSAILKVFGLSPREAIQVMERLTSTVANLRSGSSLNLYYLLILMCIKEKHPEFFPKLKNPSVFVDNSQSVWNNFVHQHSLTNEVLSIHIDTDSFFTDFVEENGSTKIRRKSNYRPVDIDVRLDQFFSSVHESMLSGFRLNDALKALGKENRSTYSHHLQFTQNYRVLWLKYGARYTEESCLDKTNDGDNNSQTELVSFYERYKDLVELSTTLDV